MGTPFCVPSAVRGEGRESRRCKESGNVRGGYGCAGGVRVCIVRLLELDDALGHDALIDALGAGLDVALARAHHHREGREHALEVVLQLTCLHGAKLGVRVLVVPRDARALALHEGAARARRVDAHDGLRHLARVRVRVRVRG
jgi:hypothetical protein